MSRVEKSGRIGTLAAYVSCNLKSVCKKRPASLIRFNSANMPSASTGEFGFMVCIKRTFITEGVGVAIVVYSTIFQKVILLLKRQFSPVGTNISVFFFAKRQK